MNAMTELVQHVHQQSHVGNDEEVDKFKNYFTNFQIVSNIN